MSGNAARRGSRRARAARLNPDNAARMCPHYPAFCFCSLKATRREGLLHRPGRRRANWRQCRALPRWAPPVPLEPRRPARPERLRGAARVTGEEFRVANTRARIGVCVLPARPTSLRKSSIQVGGLRKIRSRGAHMSREDDNKAVVVRWFTEFWGEKCNLAVVDDIAAPDMLLKYSLHEPRHGLD